MLEQSELEQARARLAEMAAPLTVYLSAGADAEDKLYQVLADTIEGLVEASDGKLAVEQSPGDDAFPGLPVLSVGHVRYLAVPRGPELPPFLDLLVALTEAPPPDADDVAPGTVRVLMAPTCPNCPVVVGAVLARAAGRPQLRVEVVDAMYFTALAGPVKSVPTVVVDGAYTVIGALTGEELSRILARREDPDFVVEALESMVGAGRFDEVLARVTSAQGLPLLPRLLSRGELKERMGIMLMAEEALERDPHCLDAAVPHLLPLLGSENPSLRGDTADLLGQIGAPGAADALKKLLSDDNEDVREVAQDALDMLREPS